MPQKTEKRHFRFALIRFSPVNSAEPHPQPALEQPAHPAEKTQPATLLPLAAQQQPGKIAGARPECDAGVWDGAEVRKWYSKAGGGVVEWIG